MCVALILPFEQVIVPLLSPSIDMPVCCSWRLAERLALISVEAKSQIKHFYLVRGGLNVGTGNIIIYCHSRTMIPGNMS